MGTIRYLIHHTFERLNIQKTKSLQNCPFIIKFLFICKVTQEISWEVDRNFFEELVLSWCIRKEGFTLHRISLYPQQSLPLSILVWMLPKKNCPLSATDLLKGLSFAKGLKTISITNETLTRWVVVFWCSSGHLGISQHRRRTASCHNNDTQGHLLHMSAQVARDGVAVGRVRVSGDVLYDWIC